MGSVTSLAESEERDARNPQALIQVRKIVLFCSYITTYLADANLFEWYGYWAQFLLVNIRAHGPCGIRELPAGHLNGIMIKAPRGSCFYQVLLLWRIT
jgi:hypothetical protein